MTGESTAGESTAGQGTAGAGLLAGRVAVVTGAGNGLGASEAAALAAAGARVVLNDLPGPALDEVAERIRAAGGEATACPGDVAEWSTGETLVRRAVETFGGLDIVVNNAGVLRDRMVFSMSEQEWDAVVRVHLRGHFVTTRFATAYWRERSKAAGAPVYARIVNTSSEAFLLGSAGQPNYAAAKGGIVALTLATARGCARYGVRVNAICPRARTAMTGELMGPAPDGPDPMSPERVAPLVTYLAGPAGERITGEVFVVHSDVVALLGPPTVRAAFHAANGQWTVAELDEALGAVFTGDPPHPGFVCEDTLPLAAATFGEQS
jgi:NAD(P)-dependent dehydrogenase (short-subunit alcohol dehydrogenase family)